MFGPILWIYIIREIQTSLFHCITHLKKKLEAIKLQNIPGENVKLFTSQFLKNCYDLGKHASSIAPFTLDKQLSSSLVEQF